VLSQPVNDLSLDIDTGGSVLMLGRTLSLDITSPAAEVTARRRGRRFRNRLKGPGTSIGGGGAPSGDFVVDEFGNFLVDESGNYITWQ
jgi:hypothetical protein